MHAGALRALEFDRIVAVLSGLAVTPTGRDRLAALVPSTEAKSVVAAQRETTEGVGFLADHPGFPLRAPADLDEILVALHVEGRALEPLRLTALAGYLESIETSRDAIARAGTAFPLLREVAAQAQAFHREIATIRRQITPAGAVADDASPSLAAIRDRLRAQRARLRTTLESFLRGSDTAKYLQDQVVTDRNGRAVLMVRAEHRSAIPGIVHGTSASGASLFVEPLQAVEISNDIITIEEDEAEEVRRILLALTDALRARAAELYDTLDVATELDVIQARARLSRMVEGVEPAISADGAFELRGARHPLLIPGVREPGAGSRIPTGSRTAAPGARAPEPVPVDVLLTPPVRVLVIAGPNTGGKTVALKTAGLFAAMAQAGLHLPCEAGSRLPVFRSLFADIGDEQSIAASLSTFSAHVTNIISMDRDLELPGLVLLDEVGAGTDPIEGGALGAATVDHFRRRGAHVVVTTHHDALKAYASTTEAVAGAAFGFDPDTFAPTYRLIYGSPGRSLAIEMARRLGVPGTIVAAAREHLSDPQKELAERLARVDEDLRRLEQERLSLARDRSAVADRERQVREREDSIRNREDRLQRRLEAKLEEQLRDARREIDTVMEQLKSRTAELSERAAVRLNTGGAVRHAGVSTGDLGAARSDARAALDRITERLTADPAAAVVPVSGERESNVGAGARVAVVTLGLEGVVIDVHGRHAEVDVHGKRLRAALRDLRVVASQPAASGVRVHVDLQPRDDASGELHLIGVTVDEAVSRLEKFLDEATLGDRRELRIVHGFGTGQLRRAVTKYLRSHALVERFEPAPDNQGGGGATVVYLKD